MQVVAVVNQKGGAGKTPTAVHLSYALSKLGSKVLFVDADPQASASLHFIGLNYKQQQPTFYNAIKSLQRIEPFAVSDNLHLLPAHDELEAAEIELAKPGKYWQVQLANLLKLYPSYDYVMIDTPGSRISVFTTIALTAANMVIVPVKTEIASQQATKDTMGLIEDVQGGLNSKLVVWGILPNQYELNSMHHREILEILKEDYKDKVYAEPSRKTTKYNDAMGMKTDIRLLDPTLGEYWDKVAVHISLRGKEAA